MKNATEVENDIITDAYYFLKRKLCCNQYPWRIMSYKNKPRTKGTPGNRGWNS